MRETRAAAILLAVLSLCLAVTSAFAIPANRAINELKHTRWAADDGAPPYIKALGQTPDGYLWIGAATGLYRFDGVTFEHPPGVELGPDQTSPIQALIVTRSGDLIVGNDNGRIIRRRNGVVTDLTPPGQIYPVRHLLEGPGGDIWAVRGSDVQPGLMRLHAGIWSIIGPSWGLPRGYVLDIYRVRDELIVVRMDGLYALGPTDRNFRLIGAYPYGQTGIASDVQGRTWISNRHIGTGLFREPLTAGKSPFRARPVTPPAQYRPRTIMFDRDGNLWGTTGWSGITRISKPNLSGAAKPAEEVFTARDGLSSDLTSVIFEDREGNIWVGTSGGLDRFRASDIVPEKSIGWQAGYGYLLFQAADGIVYAADNDTAYRIRPGQPPVPILHDISNPEAFCGAPDGTVWLASHDKIFTIGSGDIQSAPTPKNWGDVFDCVRDAKGRMWFTQTTGGLIRFDGRGWQTVPAGNLAAGDFPALLTLDPEGHVLVNINHLGLVRYVDSSSQLIWPAAKQPKSRLSFLYPSHDATLLASPDDLWRLRGNQVRRLEGARRDWTRRISGLVEARSGMTWILAGSTIVRMPTRELDDAFLDPSIPIQTRSFDHEDGLSGTSTPNTTRIGTAQGADGRLWFNTSDGIFWIDPGHPIRNLIPPAVLIKTVRVGSRDYDPAASIRLERGTNALEIDYTALSLSVPERVQFRYQLSGVDDGWINPGRRRQAFYTELNPGHYRFRVVASNNDGVWNRTGATVDFYIPPTFLQSWWFTLLCLVVIGFMLWLAYAWRIRRLSERMAERQEERIDERERIARDLHDTLLQGIQGLILRFQAIAERFVPGDPNRDVMERALERADKALVNGRERIRDLRGNPPGDIADIISDAAGEAALAATVDFRVVIEGEARTLRKAVSDEIASILAEAMVNVARHSEATSCEVSATFTHKGLHLRCWDNGRGIDPQILDHGKPGHYGLSGMRERARAVGARIVIGSRQGTGTEISLWIPRASAYVGAHARGLLTQLAFRRR